MTCENKLVVHSSYQYTLPTPPHNNADTRCPDDCCLSRERTCDSPRSCQPGIELPVHPFTGKNKAANKQVLFPLGLIELLLRQVGKTYYKSVLTGSFLSHIDLT